MCCYPVDRRICNASGKVIPKAKINRVKKLFYEGCIRDGMNDEDADTVIAIMFHRDSTKDIMAGLKAAKQRRRNQGAMKAVATRKRNARKRSKV